MLIEEKELERMVDEVSFVNSRRYISVTILVQTATRTRRTRCD